MIYDLIIIGKGPAGYSAAIYGTRYGLKTLIIGKNSGGMAVGAHQVDNYPGFISITGMDLMQKFADQAKTLGVEIKTDQIFSINKKSSNIEVVGKNGKYQGKSLILALGTEKRKMNIPGEKEFLGKGVSYCSTCDAMFFKNKTVAVIGGGDSAFQAALQLGQIANKVYMIFETEQSTAMPHWQEQVDKNKSKIILIPHNSINKITGEMTVKSVELKDIFQNKSELQVDGVFIEIGTIPNSVLLKNTKIKINNNGYIEINSNQETNISGIFAAGDITNGSGGFSQIITAASEGAIAAFSAFKYLKKVR